MLTERDATEEENRAVFRIAELLGPELEQGGFDFSIRIHGFRQGDQMSYSWQISGQHRLPVPKEP